MSLSLTISPDGFDPETGGRWVMQPDGGMVLEDPEPGPAERASSHDDNLVELIGSDIEINRIADIVCRGVEADIASRAEYMESIARATEMLGTRLQEPGASDGASGAPLEGMSVVQNPLLLDCVTRFQAEAMSELLPADGPCKIRTDEDTTDDVLANDLEDDMNHYLRDTASEYYPDTDRALFSIGLVGGIVKKIYHCPMRRRPVSEAIPFKSFIVNSGAVDISSALRVTHEIEMQHWELLDAIDGGRYAEASLSQPMQKTNTVTEAENESLGLSASTLEEDRPHTIWECYLRLSIRGLPESERGVPLPYQVTVDRDSRRVLEIRRNWVEGDERKLPREIFVLWPFNPAMDSFYPYGLMHFVGNTNRALTAAWRLAIDASMLGNFPGFLYSEAIGRQLTTNFRVPPGGGAPIQTGDKDIRAVVMDLPYKGLNATHIELMTQLEQTGQRVGMASEIKVGEGRSDAPVGTTLALIEQATKVLGAVFKRLHAAQAKELRLLRDRFREDPEAFWRFNPSPSRDWDRATLLQALNDYHLEPASDPNTPSKTHRIMRAQAVFMMAQAAPMLFQQLEVAEYCMREIGISNTDQFLVTPQQLAASQAAAAQGKGGGAAPENPAIAAQENQTKLQLADMEGKQKLAEAQLDAQSAAQDSAARLQEARINSADQAADRQSRERIEAAGHALEAAKLHADTTHQAQGLGLDHMKAAADDEHRTADRDQAMDLAQMQAETAEKTAKAAAKAKPAAKGNK